MRACADENDLQVFRDSALNEFAGFHVQSLFWQENENALPKPNISATEEYCSGDEKVHRIAYV